MIVRGPRRAALCICAVVSVWANRPANAAALLAVDDREVGITAGVREGANSFFVGITPTSPTFGDPFLESRGTGLVMSNPNGDAESSAISTHDSSFDAAPLFSTVSAAGSTSVIGSVAASATDAHAQANAHSVFDIQFTVDTPQNWSITASISDEGTDSMGRVLLRLVGGADVFTLEGTGDLSDSDSGTLAPGTYQLIGEARSSGFVTNVGSPFFFKRANFSFEFSIVPEPATGLILLACGPLLMRRRAGR